MTHPGHYLRFLFSTDKTFYRTVKNVTGIMPGNIHLYKLAFTHKSTAEQLPDGTFVCNERLEFLGDSVLSAVVADYLFKRFPYKDEGFLTQARSKIVSRNNLNELSGRIGLDQFIQYNRSSVGDNRSLHGNTLEALVGAIYLDKGYSSAKKFIVDYLMAELLDVDELLSRETDFKSKLINWAQKEKKSIVFEVMSEKDIGARREFSVRVKIDGKVAGSGRAFSKKASEQKAAEDACIKWKHIIQ